MRIGDSEEISSPPAFVKREARFATSFSTCCSESEGLFQPFLLSLSPFLRLHLLFFPFAQISTGLHITQS
jgi:hypothetical protein